MSSLRARVLASVLVLAAAGMVALGAVTYAEQSSFLQSRADQQARAAVNAMSFLLDKAGFVPSEDGEQPPEPPNGDGGGRGGRPGAGGQPNLPPGTFGQRRDASGTPIGHPLQITYSTSESAPAEPRLPAQLKSGSYPTDGSVGAPGLRYPGHPQKDAQHPGGALVV